MPCIPLLRDVTDSKKLSAAKRELIAGALVGLVPHGIGVAEVEEIDRVNILQATYLAMARAAAALSSRLDSAPDLYLIDGNRLPPPAVLQAGPRSTFRRCRHTVT